MVCGYPIHNAHFIPSSKKDAQQAYQKLLDHTNLQSLGKATFLRGWFALHFLGVGPHPDNASEWDDLIHPFLDEAWRRRQADEIEDGQYYCSCSQHQGLRLEKDGNLRCHVEGTSDHITGYISAEYDPERGNVPVLNGNKNLANIYESPKQAYRACRRLNLDRFHIYAGYPPQTWANTDGVDEEKNNQADPLSLYLTLRDDTDERTQQALEQLITQITWSKD